MPEITAHFECYNTLLKSASRSVGQYKSKFVWVKYLVILCRLAHVIPLTVLPLINYNVFPIIPFISGIELFMYVISHWFGVFLISKETTGEIK